MSNPDLRDAGPFRPALFPRTGARPGGADGPGWVRGAVSGLAGLALRTEPGGDDRGAGPADGANTGSGAVPDGGWVPSRRGRADGGALRPARGRGDADGPRFDIGVDADGYAWWYVDGLSADGRRAISIIGFIGSVFSPWYAWSGRRVPQNHVCLNVATYGPGGRFTMTDRGTAALRQAPRSLTIGPSQMRWDGGRLVIDIDEVSGPPIVSRVRGQVTVTPHAVTGVELALTPDEAHLWRPFAPSADIEVALEAPGWQWSGHGYFDANFGTRALEADFSFWTWGRFPTGNGAVCFYDADRRDGTHLEKAIRFDGEGNAEAIAPPPRARMARSLWAVRRETRGDAGAKPRQVLAMLDAPFYCRSAVETVLDGAPTVGVHEALDLDRFRSPLLKPMLAVRVPRRAGWRFDGRA